jgi:hypothetical protein
VFFVHFWANDDDLKLANGLRSALEKMVGETESSERLRKAHFSLASVDVSLDL